MNDKNKRGFYKRIAQKKRARKRKPVHKSTLRNIIRQPRLPWWVMN